MNDLLATGASYAMVLRALGDDNAKLEKRDRVTIDSIPRQAYPAAGTSWVPTGGLRGAVCCLRGPGRLRGESAGEHGLPASAYFTPQISNRCYAGNLRRQCTGADPVGVAAVQ